MALPTLRPDELDWWNMTLLSQRHTADLCSEQPRWPECLWLWESINIFSFLALVCSAHRFVVKRVWMRLIDLRPFGLHKNFKQTDKPKANFDSWPGILSGRPRLMNMIFWPDSIFMKEWRWTTHEVCSLDRQGPRDLAEEILACLSQASCQLALRRETLFFQFHHRAELLTTLTTGNSLFYWKLDWVLN